MRILNAVRGGTRRPATIMIDGHENGNSSEQHEELHHRGRGRCTSINCTCKTFKPQAALGAVETPQPPDVDYWRKSLDLVADTLMITVSETSDEKLAEKRDKLGAIVRMAVYWWRVTTGGPSAAEGQPEYHAELFEDCGHWKCDDVAKRHPELRPLAAEGPEPPPASEERRDPQ